MSNKPKNPPFHPTNHYNAATGKLDGYTEGATLRDYFAAKAMQAILSNPKSTEVMIAIFGEQENTQGHARLSLTAYRIADAMLTEREKE